MKSFHKLREELDSCCDECADDTLYGSVEEDFEPTGEEQYEDWDDISEAGPGLWANIHAKRQRIKAGSGERMREPGSKGAPTSAALKRAAESVDEAKDTDKYTYIDQSKGHVIKGKSGTYVGYTHSATKGKGANILKHNMTKKYYAAGGSSTAFTQKTTLHDTPEDAARAYHKGNLAEASPMIKPPKNEFGKKEDAFAHAKQHGGKVFKKTFTHPTSGMKDVSYVVRKEEVDLDEAIKLNSKVKIHAPGKDYHGKVGMVGEIRKGLHSKAPKMYTVDYDYNTKTGDKKSIQLDKSKIKMHNEEAELDEAIKKPNATTRHLRQYPVSDKDVAKPITYYSLVHKATNKVLSTHKDLESAKDEHRGMDQGERAHYRIATSTKAPKSFSMKEDAEGVVGGLNEMDKSAPQPGRDGKVSHSTYGSRDKKGPDYFEGKEAPVKPIKANQMFKYALNILKKQGVAEGYTGRETKDGTWRVFKDGQAVAVAGPFKSRDEAHAWIKKQKQGVAEGLELQEAEKNGKKVQLNKPFRTSDGKGKFAVYTKNDKGNVVKVNFGDTTGLTIKTSNPDRRRNFRARHNCDNPGPTHKARYWSCRSWSKGTVSAGLGI